MSDVCGPVEAQDCAGRVARGDVSVKELCQTRKIAETLYDSWRRELLEGGLELCPVGRSVRVSASRVSESDSRTAS